MTLRQLEARPGNSRPRLLMIAYHYDREYSMESRLSWQRAQYAASEYDVTVIASRGEIERTAASPGMTGAEQDLDVALLPLNRLERLLMRLPGSYYVGYRLWHRRVFRFAEQIHAENPFDIAHHVSFCGYREPSDGWRLGVPFVWGPVGGTQSFPLRFLSQVGFWSGIREVVRNAANRCQLRLDPRIRRVASASAQVMAANRAVATDFADTFGVRPLVQLETGVDLHAQTPRAKREAGTPLQILWSGRLQPWKGLPLLLRALAKLPEDRRYRLRVLGQGPCLKRWQRLAARLGVASHVEWAGWPTYHQQLPHYEWADIFAFTSLRDTSGTGLLEALAAGAPIIGLNHQGAADIMTEQCALSVDVTTPSQVIEGFRKAIALLADDRELLQTLSAGAIERARHYAWDRQWGVMQSIYRRAQPSAATFARPAADRVTSPAGAPSCLVEAI